MAYGKILVDEVENSNGDKFDLSHSSLTGTSDAGSHPASAILADDGDTVQNHLDRVAITQVETTNDLKTNDMTSSLSIGDFVQTLGYYSVGDGGGNIFEIVSSGTGTDDGGSYIDLIGGTMQAKGLFDGGVINPVMFGAKPGSGRLGQRDSDTDSSDGFIACLDYLIWMNPTGMTVDLKGMAFAISKPIKPTRTSGVSFIKITNGRIYTKSDYSGGWMIDLYDLAFVSNRSIFNSLKMDGGLNGEYPEAAGMLRFPQGAEGYLGNIHITDCEFREYYDVGIQNNDSGPATESLIANNRIKGSYRGGAESCVGIQWTGADSDIVDNIIFQNNINIEILGSAIQVRGNHLWGDARYNIYARKARALIINDNYLDNGTVHLVNPSMVIMNDNKNVCTQDTIDSWDGTNRAFVTLATDELEFVLRGFSFQGNSFRQETPATTQVTPFTVVSEGGTGSFDTTQMYEVLVKDNVFDELVTPVTTHPTMVQSITGESSVTVDFSEFEFLNWVYRYPTSCVYQGSSGSAIKQINRAGNTFTVTFDSAIGDGNVIMSVTSNSDGK